MFFGETMVKSDHLVIPTYMVPLLIISGHYDVISKKIQKIINFAVFDFWVIFSWSICAYSDKHWICFKMMGHMTNFT